MLGSAAALLPFVAVAAARLCQNITVPISISAREAEFSISPPSNEIETTDFFLRNSWTGVNYTNEILKDYHTVSGDYHLRTTYCHPDSGPGHTLQILTHGVGFDRSYWDPWFNNGNYSYVSDAVDEQGYSTLAWDRLGIAESSHPDDPLNELQVFLEIAALQELTSQFASGRVCGINTAYNSIVHVGHSFGSVITYNLANLWPEMTSGIALTGFSQIPVYLAEFALGANFVPVSQIPALADKYAEGYYAPQSAVGVQANFFAPGDFDPEILELAYQTGQPISAGEMLTVGAGTGVPNAFTGPVLIITGDRDIPFCGGNCSSTMALRAIGVDSPADNLIQSSSMYFKQASVFNATIVPHAGHGLNLAYSHPFTFSTILDFFNTHI